MRDSTCSFVAVPALAAVSSSSRPSAIFKANRGFGE
jgi:hypothetical protein